MALEAVRHRNAAMMRMALEVRHRARRRGGGCARHQEHRTGTRNNGRKRLLSFRTYLTNTGEREYLQDKEHCGGAEDKDLNFVDVV